VILQAEKCKDTYQVAIVVGSDVCLIYHGKCNDR